MTSEERRAALEEVSESLTTAHENLLACQRHDLASTVDRVATEVEEELGSLDGVIETEAWEREMASRIEGERDDAAACA